MIKSFKLRMVVARKEQNEERIKSFLACMFLLTMMLICGIADSI